MRDTTSASNLHRRLRCPGSHWAEHGLPETDSEASAEGTRLHAGLAGGEILLDDAEIITHARDMMQEAIDRAVTAFALPPDAAFAEGYEREIALREGDEIAINGHCDYWRYYPEPKLLIIVDAKFGRVEVTPAPINMQLRAYAVMGAQEWDCESVVVAIAQPRVADGLSLARYDRADLAAATVQILDARRDWLRPDAPRNPSVEACRYCKAKLLCPEYTARMTDARQGVPPGIADVEDDQFRAIFEAFEMASDAALVDAIKNEARTRILEGRLLGYRLKPNAPRRSITDNVKAAEICQIVLGFNDSELAAASKLSLTAAKTVLRKKTGLKEKDAERQLRDHLAPVIEAKTPEPSIVPEDPSKTI